MNSLLSIRILLVDAAAPTWFFSIFFTFRQSYDISPDRPRQKCYGGFMPSGEIEIIQGIQSTFAAPWGQAFVVFCARWLVFAFAPLAALTSWRKKDRHLRHAAIEAAWSALLAFFLAMTLGVAIGRVRPFRADPDAIHALIPPPASTYSLPSGHTSVAFAIAFALAFGNPYLGVPAFAIAFLVGFGRIGAGVHYPSDVLAGIGIGFLAFTLVRTLHNALRARDLRTRSKVHAEPKEPGF
jgi:undecaprenyl-diphosphatase